MTIVRLNGTHGSGKSTVAKKIIDKLKGVAVHNTASMKKPYGYLVTLPSRGEKLFIVGPYHTACGGCDAIQPFAEIWPRVKWGTEHADHVLFEGALVSTTYGAIGKASEDYNVHEFVWAFLDTPLEVCHTRVNARRAERGAEPLADFFNVDAKWHTIDRLRDKLSTGQVGNRVHMTSVINHTQPVRDVMKLFGVKLNKEPS